MADSYFMGIIHNTVAKGVQRELTVTSIVR